MKLNLDKLRNTLRTTLIDIWEYVIPIWKISGLFKRIKSKQDLANFIQERSAHVAQTTLYGYLKTRIGVKYIAMMEDEVFLKSINIAKWNIYVVALADCSFYVLLLLSFSSASASLLRLSSGVKFTNPVGVLHFC